MAPRTTSYAADKEDLLRRLRKLAKKYDYDSALYGHYGYAPYWAAAGVYPPYPLSPPRP